MNDRQLENKIHRDAAEVQKDVRILMEDSADRLGALKENVVQAADNTKEGLTTWVKDGTAQISKNIEKLTNDVVSTVTSSADIVKEDVGHGLSQYNAKAQEVADKIPGGFGQKVARYPWVALSITLVVGFLLGSLIKPIRGVLV